MFQGHVIEVLDKLFLKNRKENTVWLELRLHSI